MGANLARIEEARMPFNISRLRQNRPTLLGTALLLGAAASFLGAVGWANLFHGPWDVGAVVLLALMAALTILGVSLIGQERRPEEHPDPHEPRELSYLKRCFTKGNERIYAAGLTLGSAAECPSSLKDLKDTYTIYLVSTEGVRSSRDHVLHIPHDTPLATAWSKDTPLAVFFDEYATLWAALLWDGATTPLDNVKYFVMSHTVFKTFALEYVGAFSPLPPAA